MQDFINAPLNFIDSVGSDMVEDDVGDDQSKSNPGEAAIVATLVENLRKSGVLDKNIAVISPYAAQVQLITSLVPNSVSVKSVDGYQEKDLFFRSLSYFHFNFCPNNLKFKKINSHAAGWCL